MIRGGCVVHRVTGQWGAGRRQQGCSTTCAHVEYAGGSGL